ncbi:MAG: hypothetical protein ACREON_01690 [Gemmatimonadaceae bacterium]
MRVHRRIGAASFVPALIAVAASCGESISPTAPPSAQLTSATFEEGGPTLLSCPTDVSTYGLAVLGRYGGVVRTGPVTLSVPPDALTERTFFVIAVPRSEYMEIDVSAFGQKHFRFERSVTISIDYSRCEQATLDGGPVSAWFIDSFSKQPLEPKEGEDERDLQRLTFITDHLSGYALAQ